MNRLEQICVDRGLKMNGKRRAILQVLDEANDHPSVEEVYRRALQRDREISIATIYRTLNILAEAGILSRLELGDGKARYEDAAAGHHEHLVDVRSGAVLEFRSSSLEDLIRQAAATLGYSLVEYRLEVFGEPQSPDTPAGDNFRSATADPVSAALSPSQAPAPTSRPLPGARVATRLNTALRRKNHAHP